MQPLKAASIKAVNVSGRTFIEVDFINVGVGLDGRLLPFLSFFS
jgi:hypothetical protein